MSVQNDIDEAYTSAKQTVSSASKTYGWSNEQTVKALADIEDCYGETATVGGTLSAFYDSLSFDSIVDNAMSFGGTLSEKTGIELCMRFWNMLRDKAISWSSYPSYDKISAWLGSSVTATVTASQVANESSPTGAIVDGAKETADDYAKVAQTAGNTASNPLFWYGLAGAATLGLFAYVRRAF